MSRSAVFALITYLVAVSFSDDGTESISLAESGVDPPPHHHPVHPITQHNTRCSTRFGVKDLAGTSNEQQIHTQLHLDRLARSCPEKYHRKGPNTPAVCSDQRVRTVFTNAVSIVSYLCDVCLCCVRFHSE